MVNNNSPTLVHRKVAILGFRAVGKSSLTHSFVTGAFSDAYVFRLPLSCCANNASESVDFFVPFLTEAVLPQLLCAYRYDPTIESTQHKTIRFRRVHFATNIVDTAGMVRFLVTYCVTSMMDQFYVLIVSLLSIQMFCQDEYSRLSRNASLGVHGYALVFSIISRKSFETIQQVNDSLLNTLGDAPDVPRVLVGSMQDLGDQRQVSKEVSLGRNFEYALSDDAAVVLPCAKDCTEICQPRGADENDWRFLLSLCELLCYVLNQGRAKTSRYLGRPLHWMLRQNRGKCCWSLSYAIKRNWKGWWTFGRGERGRRMSHPLARLVAPRIHSSCFPSFVPSFMHAL